MFEMVLFVRLRNVIFCMFDKVFFFIFIRFLLVIWKLFKFGKDFKFLEEILKIEFLFKIRVVRCGRIVLFLYKIFVDFVD